MIYWFTGQPAHGKTVLANKLKEHLEFLKNKYDYNNRYKIYRIDGDDMRELFSNKKIIIFSLPGAFTPTCSTYQLPGFENNFDKFREKGIDDIYVVSVNDAFVMNAWASDLGIKNIKIIPDGNCEFTTAMGMNVTKSNLGFGIRSWRYAAIIDNCKIEKIFEEPGKSDDFSEDPYGETSPENIMSHL